MREKEALLGGESVYNHRPNRRSWLVYILESANVLLIIWLLYGPIGGHSKLGDGGKAAEPVFSAQSKKNVIFMVTDGMGPASLSLARSFKQFRDGLTIDDILELDKHLIGSSRTRSSSLLVTDLAAGATAFLCGLKSYNGAIGVDPEKNPCGTILEELKLQGYMTGLVVTTRITDATPAAFSAHADYRSQEDLIAQQQLGESPLGRVVDLIIGGGRCHFLPQGAAGSCRADSRDLVSEAKRDGWSYVSNRAEFDQLQQGKNVSFPLLGLVASTDIPYDIDRKSSEYPSLAEQVRTALTALSEATKDSEQGFFILIEGSRIDHAGHHNDPAAQVREVLAYDEAFKEVKNFVDNTEVDTVVLLTSDHETGGLVTARQVSPNYPDYLWYPEVLLNSTHSGEFLARKVLELAKTMEEDLEANDELKEQLYEKFELFIVKEIVESDMGIKDYTSDEIALLKANSGNGELLLYLLNNMISVRSQTGWTTHGHSAVDVNIYGYTNSEAISKELHQQKAYTGLLGNHENIEIGSFMERLTGANLKHITEKISGIKHSPRTTNTEELDAEAKAFEHDFLLENIESEA